MGVLYRIPKKEIRDLLARGWLTHDWMGFLHVDRDLGILRASGLNRKAIKSLAPFEMERIKRALNVKRVEVGDFDRLMESLLAALEVTLPETVCGRFSFSSPQNGLIHWQWREGQCFAYKGMKRIRALDEYRCCVIYRLECCLENLGLKCSVHPEMEGCLMHQKGFCEGEIRVF
jgi:hypothetical protein